jgi:hypothetical protein
VLLPLADRIETITYDNGKEFASLRTQYPNRYSMCARYTAEGWVSSPEHLRVAAQLRQLTDNPKAQELALHHDELARTKGIGQQTPPTH